MNEPEDEYWAASSVKNSRKKVNIFDDNVTVEAATDLALYKKNLQDEDDVETVGWDDTPVSRPRPDSSFPKPAFEAYGSSAPSRPDPPISSSSASYMTHNRSRSDVLVGDAGKMRLTKSPSSPQDSLSSRIDSEPNIATMLGVPDPMRPAAGERQKSTPEQEEVEVLRRQLKEAQLSLNSATVKVEDTIKRMLLGQPYQLEQYKAMADKLKLLDKAMATHDGNCIIAAVMFLKRTLTDQLFNMEMMRRPVAVDQYLAYLKAHYNYTELEKMLGLLGRSEELAMMKFKQIVAVDDPMAKIDRLKTCLRAHFETTASLQHDGTLIQQQINILHRQRPVDVADDMAQKEGKHVVFRALPRKASILHMPVITTLYYCCMYHYKVADDMAQKEGKHVMFRALPRKASILHMPVITTLYYCCMYHYEEPENLLGSPLGIKKEHQLTEKQFVWTAVKARAKLKKWADVEALFTTKSWLGGTKMKSVIGFEKVAGVLHKAGAPTDVTGKYLNLIDDVERRMELATKMECHEVTIDAFRNQKDRRGLEQYQRKLKPNSREWFYAKDVLNSNQTKWKT